MLVRVCICVCRNACARLCLRICVCEFAFAVFMLLSVVTGYVAQEVGVFFYIDVCIFKVGDEGEFEDV